MSFRKTCYFFPSITKTKQMMMKMQTDAAHAGKPSEGLEQVQLRFSQWRAGRQRSARIPRPYRTKRWGMALQHGVQSTAQALRLDRVRLTLRQLCAAAPPCLASIRFSAGVSNSRWTAPWSSCPIAAQSTQLVAPTIPVAEPPLACPVEMDNAQGGKMCA